MIGSYSIEKINLVNIWLIPHSIQLLIVKFTILVGSKECCASLWQFILCNHRKTSFQRIVYPDTTTLSQELYTTSAV